MKIFKKTKDNTGRRHIYFCGIKVFSYKKKLKNTLNNKDIYLPTMPFAGINIVANEEKGIGNIAIKLERIANGKDFEGAEMLMAQQVSTFH